MKNISRLFLAFALLSVGASAGAEKIYESVDDKGVVEFSDQPSSDSKQVDVKPNVVDIAPAPSGGVSSSPAATATKPEQSVNTQVEGVGVNYDDDRRRDKIPNDRNVNVLPEVQGVQEPGRSHQAGQAVNSGVHKKSK